MESEQDGVTLVVGAGLSGLVSAYRWRQRGVPVILAETAPHVGGMARSIRVDGFTFDFGPHVIIERTRLLDELFSERDLIEFTPRTDIVIGKRWVRFPFTPSSLLKVPTSVQWDFLRTRTFGVKSGHDLGPPCSFRRNMSGVFGPAMYEYFFRPYITKKLGGMDLSDSLHSDWWTMSEHDRGVVTRGPSPVARRSSSPFRAIWKAARVVKELPWVFRSARLLYPRGGFGEICRRLTDRILDLGVDLRLGTEVRSLQRDEGSIMSVTLGDTAVPVRRLIWTGSPNVLARMLGTAPLTLPLLHLVVYFVTMDKRYPRRGTEVRPLAPEIPFYRGYFPECISPELTPEGRSAIVTEMGVARIEDLNGVERQHDAVADACVDLGLCPRSGITSISHAVQPNCYPLYTLDYEQHLQRFYADLAPIRNLILAGRNARFQYINSHQAIGDGERTIEDRLF